MDAKELKTLRYGAELTQSDAAKLCGVTFGTFQKYERGTTAVPEETADRIRRELLKVQKQVPIADSMQALRIALGEAVIMLTEEQREELYERGGPRTGHGRGVARGHEPHQRDAGCRDREGRARDPTAQAVPRGRAGGRRELAPETRIRPALGKRRTREKGGRDGRGCR